MTLLSNEQVHAAAAQLSDLDAVIAGIKAELAQESPVLTDGPAVLVSGQKAVDMLETLLDAALAIRDALAAAVKSHSH